MREIKYPYLTVGVANLQSFFSILLQYTEKCDSFDVKIPKRIKIFTALPDVDFLNYSTVCYRVSFLLVLKCNVLLFILHQVVNNIIMCLAVKCICITRTVICVIERLRLLPINACCVTCNA